MGGILNPILCFIFLSVSTTLMGMKLICLVTVLVLLLLSSNPIQAEEASIGVYPPILEIKAKEGAVVEAPITIVNGSETLQQIGISLEAFDVRSNTNGTVQFIPKERISQRLKAFLNSVSFVENGTDVKTINLYPKESINLILTFPVVESSSEEFYFSPIFSILPTSLEASGTTASVSAGISVLVFASLNETPNLKPDVKSFSTGTFHNTSPIEFRLEAQNTGNHFKNIRGKMLLYNMFGGKAGETEIPAQIITANSSRTLQLKGNKPITWEEKFPFGFYTAKAVLSYENGPTVSKDTSFFVLPLLPLLILLALLVFILGVMLRVIRKLNLREK